MKAYFLTDSSAMIMSIGPDGVEPEHIASFDIPDGASTFAPRYALGDGKLVDKFPGKTDEEVAAALQQAEVDKAKALEADTPKGPLTR